MYKTARDTAQTYPDRMVYVFLGQQSSYQIFLNDIDHVAAVLNDMWLSNVDRITICMPNIAISIIAFYAINKIGAIASMIHPLSSAKEIEYYLNLTESTWAMSLDVFYPNFNEIIGKIKVNKIIVSKLTKGRKIVKPDTTEKVSPDTKGEICDHSPTVMIGYLNDEGEKLLSIIGIFAGLALFLSLLGIIALSVLFSERKINEIGIRKVNGAQSKEILVMLNSNFIRWITLAFVVACPVTWIVIRNSWKILLTKLRCFFGFSSFPKALQWLSHYS